MRIYLDHNATVPLRPAAVEGMRAAFEECAGNPSSPHAEGARARATLERARAQVAACIGALPQEIVWTSGATEANNFALFGAAKARGTRGRHIVTSALEHPSVLRPLARLEQEGWEVTYVAVDGEGLIDPEVLLAAVRRDTVLVSLLWANNETGVIQPVAEIAGGLAERGVPLHLDATQALGKLVIDTALLPAAWISASAHKLGGPTGSGFLYARRGLALEPLLHGGPQERGLRGGTENTLGAVGTAAAVCAVSSERAAAMARDAALRDRLWQGILEKIPALRRNGSEVHVLANTLNVEFVAAPGDILLQALDLEGIAASSGSACASGSIEASHVLLAMGRTPEQARCSLRFSVGPEVGEAEIEHVLRVLPDLVARVRRCTA